MHSVLFYQILGPPRQPSEVKLISGDFYPIISWNPAREDTISEILSYHIEVKEKHEKEYSTLVELGNLFTTYELNNLKPGKYYDVRIRAKNPLGLSEPLILPDQIFINKELGKYFTFTSSANLQANTD